MHTYRRLLENCTTSSLDETTGTDETTSTTGHVIVEISQQHTVSRSTHYLRECIHSFGAEHFQFANVAADNGIDIGGLWEANSREEMYEMCEGLFEYLEADVTKDKVDAVVRVLEEVRDQHPGCRAPDQTSYIAPAWERE